MPYKSEKQRRWAHTEDAKKKGFPTAEFDKESKVKVGVDKKFVRLAKKLGK